MTFLIKFIRPKKELAPFESKYLDCPIVADDPSSAVDIFNKFLGRPYGYKIVKVSVIGYEKED